MIVFIDILLIRLILIILINTEVLAWAGMVGIWARWGGIIMGGIMGIMPYLSQSCTMLFCCVRVE